MDKAYLVPSSLEEALSFLREGQARIVAGGTDLYLNFKKGLIKQPASLIDITSIPGLQEITQRGDSLELGAAVTHAQLEESEVIKKFATALGEAAYEVGSPQIRYVGTVGGNIVNAAPAADTAVPLVAYHAEAEIWNCNNEKETVPVGDLYADINKSKLDSSHQILTFIRFRKLMGNEGSSFQRFSKRRSLSLPVVNVAVVLSLNDDDSVADVRIVVAPTGPAPGRLQKTEELIVGKVLEEPLLKEAAGVCSEELVMRTSALRGSGEFRKKIGELLVQRTLREAAKRAGWQGE